MHGGTYTSETKVLLDISVRHWTWYTRESSSYKIPKGERATRFLRCVAPLFAVLSAKWRSKVMTPSANENTAFLIEFYGHRGKGKTKNEFHRRRADSEGFHRGTTLTWFTWCALNVRNVTSLSAWHIQNRLHVSSECCHDCTDPATKFR